MTHDHEIECVLQDGVIVTLTIGRWRGMLRLDKRDLALHGLSDEFVRNFLVLGKKTLLPPRVQKKLNSIEVNARYSLRRYAFDTPFGFFVPAAAYALVDENMNKWRADWMEMRDQLCCNLDAYTSEVEDAYRRFVAKDTNEVEIIRANPDYIVSLIPSTDEIRSSFRFEFQAFQIPVLAVPGNVQRDILGDRRSQRIRMMHERITAKCTREGEQLVDGFVRSVNLQLQDLVFETVNIAIGSISRNQKLVGKAAAQLRNLVNRFRLLNFIGDTATEQQLGELEALIKEKPFDVEELRHMLGIISSNARTVMVELGVPERDARRLEVEYRSNGHLPAKVA